MATQLPLKMAYPYLQRHGVNINYIKELNTDAWTKKSYSSSVRRGYVIRELVKLHMLEQFISEHWNQDSSKTVRSSVERYLRIANEFDGIKK
ncbi:hypothetical protein [Photobacterium lucens]|uniref:hypothetical protein n=1 Tax=Photobacterium lucens TaxID=2562949 RepID=UPI000D179B12|nr:hypothetical protein [Photobacterium lucens]MBP2698563.1 hypothetical protein [Vibrio parahaemolyticus]MZG55425.1 hypothetical protein [Photobacterium lucens]MZG81419.1 hypothetical protein [Photobacterium lucens]PSV18404.1 hypothetical protein C0W44_19255 [Photobacterium leiognathi subsp. mandapamensis]